MNSKVKQNKARRQILIDDIEEILVLAQAAVTDQSLHVRFRLRYESLEEIHSKFQTLHSAIIVLLANSDEPDYNAEKSVRAAFTDNYFTIKTIYVNLFPVVIPETNRISKSPSVKLPKIVLPIFDGNYKEWPTFYDLFKSLVHENSNLSQIEKFQYLLSSLSSQALNLLKGFPLTAQNYENAFQTLTDRYQNRRLLANTCWNEIYNISKLHSESASGLRRILEVFSENLAVLKNLGLPTDQWDFVLFHLLIQKLDTATIKRFELQECSTDIPSFINLQTFLTDQCVALESVALSVPSKSQQFSDSRTSKFNNTSSKRNSALLVQSKNNSDKKGISCNYCKSSHNIYNCPSFLGKTASDRFKIVKDKNWCINCLHSGHQLNNCSSKSTCRTCNKKHHSLLHMRSPSDDVPQNESCQSQSQTSYFSHSNSVNLLPANSTVLLATAQVDIQDAWGNFQKVRVLLDAGSQINIISQSCVNKLGLQISKTALSITGIGESSSTASGSTVCSIRPTGQINPSFTFDAVVLPKICTQMPTSLVQFSNWKCISNKKLADPEFFTPHSVDILLGADIFPLVLKDGRIKGNGSEPTALETVFGWVFMGQIQSPSRSMNSFHLSLCDSSLNSTLKRFWELEEVPTTTSSSPEDQRCEQLFVEGHSRDASGRYTVALPFESGKCVRFGDTYSLALRRFLSLERRLIRTPEVYQEYCHFMKDYLSSNHMSSVITDVETENNFYIPHHCIIKPDSASTKLRVVFDASAHLPGKLSLNDALLIGPKLQKDIFVILLNFRVHTFVFTADIKQMYRQILIQPSHRDYQKILWRFSPSEPIGAYRLNTVTYGVAPAPFLALRTLSQLAEDEGASFPNASKILLRDIYVDDIVTGCDDLGQAKVLVDELISLLECGGFELRKWCSNSHELLSRVPLDHQHQHSINFDADSAIKILGLK
ncbi:uncharacterized protein LOC123682646 [Harmonia axyridis]|uniref:uncharacterized protein LOC123682646 n=1 Tax=Harmonia axyridis TaxID=115357 RepID=UPI001E277BD4|nr:uncharacterized protein LOC123682646 [Harmonia axyridis]